MSRLEKILDDITIDLKQAIHEEDFEKYKNALNNSVQFDKEPVMKAIKYHIPREKRMMYESLIFSRG